MPTQAPTGVDAGVVGDHRDLGAAARVAGHGAYFDDAVIDLRHLLGEQAHQELVARARQEDLRAARLFPDLVDQGPDALIAARMLARNDLVSAKNRLGLAEINDHMAELVALDQGR